MQNSNLGDDKLEYEGKDWTELSKQFGLFENDLEDEITLQKTKDYLVSKHFSDTESVSSEIRLFLRALCRNCDGNKYTTPIWKGLLNVEDDFTLIKYTIVLLEHMWY